MTSEGPQTTGRSGHQRGRQRTFWHLVLYRTGLILLATLLLLLARGEHSGLNLQRALPFLDSTLGLWCLYQLVVLTGFALRRRPILSRKLDVTADLIFSLALVWWTGGVESFFLPILYANVLATSTFFGLRRAQLVASGATLTLVVMTVGRINGWSPAEWTGLSPFGVQGRIPFISICLIGEGIAFHIIAFLGARLMGGLRRAEQINRLIIENIGEGILVLDDRKRLLVMNAEAFRILGYEYGEECRGKSPEELFRRQDDTPIRNILQNPVPGEYRVQCRIARKEWIPLSLRLTRVAGDSTGGSVWVVVFRDLTLEIRAQEAEARVRRSKEMEDLALGLVHEIRNPLASIRGCVQELGRGNLDADQADKFARITIRESDRLDRIVNDFLEYSRTGPTHQEPIALRQLLDEVVETLTSRPDAEQVQIEVSGELEESGWVSGQRELIYRVFLNLGINALEAIDGAGHVRFHVGPGRLDGWEVRVEDDGPGMGAETLERIFHPFFTTKPREGGLGLALAERVVHAHDGVISVESQTGLGTRFRVWLPGLERPQSVAPPPRLIGAAS